MRAVERFIDARGTVEGRVVATALTALLAFSAFTPTALAVADEVTDEFDETSLPVNDVAMPSSEAEEPESDPEPEDGVETGVDEGDESDASFDGEVDDESALTGLAELEGESNDGATVRVQAPAGTVFPAGSSVRVETALSDTVEAALAATLENDERFGMIRAYKIELVDAEGNPLSAIDGAVAFLTSEGVPTFDVSIFRIIGDGEAQKIDAPTGLVPDLTALAFPIEAASSVYAFAMIEEDEGEQAPDTDEQPAPQPAPEEADNSTNPGSSEDATESEQPSDPSDEAPEDDSDSAETEDEGEEAPEAQSIIMYMGESRTLACPGLHAGHQWMTADEAVAAIQNTSAQRVTVEAGVPGKTTVRCDNDAVYEVTVKAAPEHSAITHFYFLPPTTDGSAADLTKAQYMGSGVVDVPAGFDGVSQLVNGSVLPATTDNSGNVVSERVINLDDLIAEAPSDAEVRVGLASYFNGSIDGAQNGTASKMKYDASWTYTYEPVVFTGKINSEGYNGSAVKPQSAHHMYVQMKIAVPEQHYTVSYAVQTPSGSEFRSILHTMGDAAIELNGYTSSASALTVDGVTYPAIKTVGDTVKYHFDGWYTDTTYRTKAPRTYSDAASATFFARYLTVDAKTASFDPAGGVFADNTAEVKSVSADEGATYWLLDAPKRFGYTFIGWRAKGSEAYHEANVSRKMGSSNIEYEALWKAAPATISFDAREGSLDEDKTLLEGTTAASLEGAELPVPTRLGYKFAGWYDNAAFMGAPINELPSAFPAGNTVYYAKYEEDPAQRYTVTYQVQRGHGGHLKRDIVLNYGEVIVDSGMIVDSNEGVRGATAVALIGYQFAGWKKITPEGEVSIDTSNGTGVPGAELTAELACQNLNRDANDAYMDTTYVATFIPLGTGSHELRDYTVEYYLMDDDGTYPAEPNCAATLTGLVNTAVLVDDVVKNYDLNGGFVTHFGTWPSDYNSADYVADDAAPGRVYDGWIGEKDAAPVLKVYLQKRLEVSFDAAEHGVLEAESFGEGAVQEDAVVTYRCLKGDAVPAVPTVAPEAGYEFVGWSEKGTDVVVDPAAEPVSRAVAYEACYAAQDAALRFDTNGGSEVADIERKTGESLADLALPATDREGYTFQGWFDADGNELTSLPAAMPAGEIVYTARWEANAATIVFNKNASDAVGSVLGRQGVTDAPVNAAFPTDIDLSRPGYLFAGWNTQADGKGLTVDSFPATFPAGETVYYAQWKLDVSELSASSFSYQATYDGRAHRIAVPTGLALKEGEQLAMKVNGVWTTNANLFPVYKDVADSASGIEVAIFDRDGNQVFVTDEVSVALAPAELTVATGSIIHPFDGTVATSDQIVVSGLRAGETVGARTTGFASQVGEEVQNTFELTWAGEGNSYTAKQGNYVVTAKLGTVKVVTTSCPVTIEGYVGVYDGQEHALVYGSPEAKISFDADTAYTEAGDHQVGYTVSCPDHGTFTGTVSVNIIPRAITIEVEDSYKIATARDPLFKGAIVEGTLVADDDLGTIDFVRTFEGNEVGVYEGGLTAQYRQNDNYAVTVIPGTFTIGPADAGGAGSVNQHPLTTPGGGDGAAVTGTVATGTPLAQTSTRTTSATVTTLSAARELLEAARPASMADLAAPVYADVIGDDGVPMVIRKGGETIEDDATALGAFDEPHCWVHWVMAFGILLTIAYAAAVVSRRLGYARRAARFDDDLTGGSVVEDASVERAAQRQGA